MNVKTCEYLHVSFSHFKNLNLELLKCFSQIHDMLLLKLFLFKIKKEIK